MCNYGDTILLKNLNLFSLVNNIELYPFKKAELCRAAGTSALVTGKNNNKVFLKLNNGINLFLSINCLCTRGIVSNSKHKFINYKKAGIKRYYGKRPIVRGVAKNPCDHPHGGGEGKKSPPVNHRSP
jgi:large subunit ribosomal protein L2